MTVLLTLTTAGTDTSNFELYSDVDGFQNAFEINVSKVSLLNGYTTSLVPDYTNEVRVKSTNKCVNFIDIALKSLPEPTTTTTIP
jgi:hypothetical protein